MYFVEQDVNFNFLVFSLFQIKRVTLWHMSHIQAIMLKFTRHMNDYLQKYFWIGNKEMGGFLFSKPLQYS